MCSAEELVMQQAALDNPGEALKIFNITKESGKEKVHDLFMQAYIKVNGGQVHNTITRARVEAAANDWLHYDIIEPWLARACVLQQMAFEPTSS